MTKEENIATLNEHLEHWKRLLSEKICDQSEGEKTIDALQNAIKALEQEPCDDAISRQSVLDINEHYHGQMPNHVNHEIWKEINALPSVTVQPKMGRWIEDTNGTYTDNHDTWECSECGHAQILLEGTPIDNDYNYCPNCGAKMQEVEK